jgi:hypothetical protein
VLDATVNEISTDSQRDKSCSLLTEALVVSAHCIHQLERLILSPPPDPISHLHPVIYDDVPCTPNRITHPYSLSGFTASANTKLDCELQLKWHREQLDNFNQKFWFEYVLKLREMQTTG